MTAVKQRVRIIGQCSQSDFTAIEQLTVQLTHPSMLDMSALSKRQIFAFNFYNHLYKKSIPYALARDIVREVLFWGDTDFIQSIEIKFKTNADKNEVKKFKRLWL
jgi:hypothetical protein